jgi:hypothetical protein
MQSSGLQAPCSFRRTYDYFVCKSGTSTWLPELTRTSGPEIVNLGDPNGPLLPKNYLEKVGSKPSTFFNGFSFSNKFCGRTGAAYPPNRRFPGSSTEPLCPQYRFSVMCSESVVAHAPRGTATRTSSLETVVLSGIVATRAMICSGTRLRRTKRLGHAKNWSRSDLKFKNAGTECGRAAAKP